MLSIVWSINHFHFRGIPSCHQQDEREISHKILTHITHTQGQQQFVCIYYCKSLVHILHSTNYDNEDSRTVTKTYKSILGCNGKSTALYI